MVELRPAEGEVGDRLGQQAVLRQLFAVDGVTGTQTIVVLESFFERPVDVREEGTTTATA